MARGCLMSRTHYIINEKCVMFVRIQKQEVGRGFYSIVNNLVSIYFIFSNIQLLLFTLLTNQPYSSKNHHLISLDSTFSNIQQLLIQTLNKLSTHSHTYLDFISFYYFCLKTIQMPFSFVNKLVRFGFKRRKGHNH